MDEGLEREETLEDVLAGTSLADADTSLIEARLRDLETRSASIVRVSVEVCVLCFCMTGHFSYNMLTCAQHLHLRI
jgi:hypothetical protein